MHVYVYMYLNIYIYIYIHTYVCMWPISTQVATQSGRVRSDYQKQHTATHHNILKHIICVYVYYVHTGLYVHMSIIYKQFMRRGPYDHHYLFNLVKREITHIVMKILTWDMMRVNSWKNSFLFIKRRNILYYGCSKRAGNDSVCHFYKFCVRQTNNDKLKCIDWIGHWSDLQLSLVSENLIHSIRSRI